MNEYAIAREREREREKKREREEELNNYSVIFVFYSSSILSIKK
jgi:hypothetical protein